MSGAPRKRQRKSADRVIGEELIARSQSSAAEKDAADRAAKQASPPEVLGFMLAQQQGLFMRRKRRLVLLRSLRCADAPRRWPPPDGPRP